MSHPVRIAVHGAAGRMGRALIQAAAADPAVRLAAAIERGGAPELGQDAATLAGLPPCGVLLDVGLKPENFDVLIDFTRPEPSLAAVDACERAGKALVIGTTGFTAVQRVLIESAARRVPVCLSGNFSIGINLCQQLVTQAARALGERFDIEIVEAHHRAKVDAPSGTALMLGEAAARGSGRELKDVAVYERHGHTGARDGKTIGFAAIRGGDVVGDHTVMFLGDGERIEITHRATTRMNFAAGAIRAAAWIAGRRPGLYSMQDVLGL
jgi:4-hydroxy-tetrahydrodipicolinate reductase